MVAAFFEELGTIASSFVSFLVSLFQSVVGLFWTPAAEGTGGSLTVIGTFMLIGIATGLVIWAFHYIRSLVRIKTHN